MDDRLGQRRNAFAIWPALATAVVASVQGPDPKLNFPNRDSGRGPSLGLACLG
jgi:hypothetical protein